MAKFEKRVYGDFQKILDRINYDILQSGLSMNLVDQTNYNLENIKIAVRVYDKYFMRNGNRASLSVTIVDNGSEVYISAIGAGGGNGIFFNFSWGAESELTDVVAGSIKRMGL